MIGGLDLTFRVPSGPAAVESVVRLVARWWPACVFAIDDDPAVYTDFADLTFHERSEVIIYRDRVAGEAWDELGYDDTLKGTMVYVLCSRASLTLVTEHEPCPAIRQLANAIRRSLESGRSHAEAA